MSYTFFNLNVPGATDGTSPSGINNSGQVVGTYTDASGKLVGFIDTNGTISTIDVPGTIGGNLSDVDQFGINDSGEVVGDYIDATGISKAFIDTNGTISTIHVPGTLGAQAFGINDAGQVVGEYYVRALGAYDQGFIDIDGAISTIDLAGSLTAAFSVDPLAINNFGTIVGYFSEVDSLFPAEGFIYANGGFSTLDVPGATEGTYPSGINDSGTIVGFYEYDVSTFRVGVGGFIDINGTITTIDVPGAIVTALTGINNSGQIVGDYVDATGIPHGFIATEAEGFLSTDGATADTTHEFWTDNGWQQNEPSGPDGQMEAEPTSAPGPTASAYLGGYLINAGVATPNLSSGGVALSGEVGTVEAVQSGLWTLTGNPTIDDLIINAATLAEAGQLAVSPANGSDGEVSVTNGGTLTTAGPYDNLGIGAASTITVTADGVGSLWKSAGQIGVGINGDGTLVVSNKGSISAVNEIDVGENADGSGNFTIESGGRATSGGTNDTIGGVADADGTVTVTGSGSSWILSAAFAIGNGGTGTLSIQNGGSVQNGGTYTEVGNQTGAIGVVSVQGPQATWSMSSQLAVGYQGTGDIAVASGGTLSSAGPYDSIGGAAGGDGTVTVDGTGSLRNSAGQIGVGGSGDGTLTVSNEGSLDATNEIDVGENAGGNGNFTIESGGRATSGGTNDTIGGVADADGTVTVTGSGSSWILSAAFAIGNGGTGTLSIQNGGSVQNGGTYTEVGNQTGAIGVVSVQGPQATWSMSSQLAVGYQGTGDIAVASGGTLSSAGPYDSIGGAAGGDGTVTVDGTGSLWNSAGQIGVGGSGDGTLAVSNKGSVSGVNEIDVAENAGSSGDLTIESGGTVTSGGTYDTIGVFAGSNGTVTVNGAGSLWQSTGQLEVGYLGNGTLDVGSGGTVNTGSVEVGSTGIINLSGGTIDSTAITLESGGEIIGSGTISAPVINDGTMESQNGTLTIDSNVTGDGQFLIDQGSVLELSGSSSFSGAITFGPTAGATNAVLKIDRPLQFNSPINGLQIGDTIDLVDQIKTEAIDRNELILSDLAGNSFTYQIAGNIVGKGFLISSDGSGGSDLMLQAPPALDNQSNELAGKIIDAVQAARGAFLNGTAIALDTGEATSLLEASDTLANVCAAAGVSINFTVAGATLVSSLSQANSEQARYAAVEAFDVNITNTLAKAVFVYLAAASPAVEVAFLEGLLGATVAVGTGPLVVTALLGVALGYEAGLAYDKWLKPTVTSYEIQNFESAHPPPVNQVLDGYLSRATVFADANGTGQLAPNDVSTTTDAEGNFTLIGGTGPLVAIGGTDTATNLPFTGRLTAPSGSTVVTPLTTLVQALNTGPNPLSIAAAEQAVLTTLGLTLPDGTDLDHFDAIAGLLAGTAGAAATYAAGTEVYDTIRMAAAALGGSATAQADLFAALVNGMAASASTPLNLTSAATIGGIISDAQALDPSLPPAPSSTQLAQIADVIAAGNTLAHQGAAAGTPTDAYKQISAAAHVAQGDATTALGNLANLDTAVTNFTGTPLSQAVTAAEAEVSIPCFCPGTMILTQDGQRTVETLRIGDSVLTASGEARPIAWIGSGRVLLRRGQRCAATPIIVRQGALGPNVPHRDLRITKGHSLFIDDVLIPAEFLVNHRSILWDDHAQVTEFYHIELKTHDVLLANGAPAESYRDDCNRGLFHNGNSGWDLPAHEPCAPVLTGGLLVDTVWRRLLDRAGPRSGESMTDDPDLHLLIDGRRVDGKALAGGIHMFRLPERPGSVRVISRAGAPDVLGITRDPRLLGVAIRQIRLWRGARLRLIEASDPSLDEGFHLFEEDNGFLWTDGNARLPAALFDGINGPCDLEVSVGGTTRYPLYCEPVRAAAA